MWPAVPSVSRRSLVAEGIPHRGAAEVRLLVGEGPRIEDQLPRGDPADDRRARAPEPRCEGVGATRPRVDLADWALELNERQGAAAGPGGRTGERRRGTDRARHR